MSSLAQREKIEKKLQLLREQREREQRAFEELAHDNENLSAAEITALAMKKAEDSAPKSLCVDGVEMCIGDRVRVCKDVARFVRSEQVNVVTDPVKSIYLGETGRITQVLQSLKGKHAVEMCFADGAEKIFFTDCLDVEDARRRKTSTSIALSNSSIHDTNANNTNHRNSNNDNSNNRVDSSQARAGATAASSSSSVRSSALSPSAFSLTPCMDRSTAPTHSAPHSDEADRSSKSSSSGATAPLGQTHSSTTPAELSAPHWNDLKRLRKPASTRSHALSSHIDVSLPPPPPARTIQQTATSATALSQPQQVLAQTKKLHVDAARDMIDVSTDTGHALAPPSGEAEEIVDAGELVCAVLMSPTKPASPARNPTTRGATVAKTKRSVTTTTAAAAEMTRKGGATNKKQSQSQQQQKAIRRTKTAASAHAISTTIPSRRSSQTKVTDAPVAPPFTSSSSLALALALTASQAQAPTSGAAHTDVSDIATNHEVTEEVALSNGTDHHCRDTPHASPHTREASAPSPPPTSATSHFQRLGLVKEALSDRIAVSCDVEELGKPDEQLYLRSRTPLSLGAELDELITTPRSSSSSTAPSAAAAVSVMAVADEVGNEEDTVRPSDASALPRRGPAGYRARFALNDRATCIPRWGGLHAAHRTTHMQQRPPHTHASSHAAQPRKQEQQKHAKQTQHTDTHEQAKEAGEQGQGVQQQQQPQLQQQNPHPHALHENGTLQTQSHSHETDAPSAASAASGSVRAEPSRGARATRVVQRGGESVTRATQPDAPSLSYVRTGGHPVHRTPAESRRADSHSAAMSGTDSLLTQTSSMGRRTSTSTRTTSTRSQPAFQSAKVRQVRVYENGVYDEDAYEHVYRVVTVRPTYKTMKALRSVIEREMGWRDGKRVDILYDASGAEIVSLDELFDGESIVASAGDRFIVPFPNTSLHREALKLAMRVSGGGGSDG